MLLVGRRLRPHAGCKSTQYRNTQMLELHFHYLPFKKLDEQQTTDPISSRKLNVSVIRLKAHRGYTREGQVVTPTYQVLSSRNSL
jgi:hypothetical protein